MAPRATIVLKGKDDRAKAINWIGRAPDGWRLEFKEPVRSLDQNAKMWAMLTDISNQVEWYGRKLSPTDWKCMFSAALKKATVVPDLEGTSFVMLGLHTSDMSKEEMSNMLELIYKFGAEKGVVWTEQAA